MAEQNVPESWISERVGLILGGQQKPLVGELLEVNDRGIVIDYFHNAEEFNAAEERGDDDVEPLFLHFFFPWRSIVGIHQMPPEQEE